MSICACLRFLPPSSILARLASETRQMESPVLSSLRSPRRSLVVPLMIVPLAEESSRKTSMVLCWPAPEGAEAARGESMQ